MSSFSAYDEFDYSKLKPIPGLPYQFPVSHYLKGHNETRPKEEPCPTWVSKGFQHQEEVFDFEVTHGLPGNLFCPGELEVPYAESRIKRAGPAEGVFKYIESCQMQSRQVEMIEARDNEERLFASRALQEAPFIAAKIALQDATVHRGSFAPIPSGTWIEDPRFPAPKSVLDLTCGAKSPSLRFHDDYPESFVMGVFDHSPFSGRECLSTHLYESPRFAAHVGYLLDRNSDVMTAVSGPSYLATSEFAHFSKGDVPFPKFLARALHDGAGYDLIMADCTILPPRLEMFRYRARWVEWWNFRRFLSAVQVFMELGGTATTAKFKLAGLRMEGTLVILRYLRRCFQDVRIQFCHFRDPLSADVILTVSGPLDVTDNMALLNTLSGLLDRNRYTTWINIGAWLPRRSPFRANMRNVIRTQDAIMARFAKMVLRSFYIKYGKGQLDLDHPSTAILANARPSTCPMIFADVPQLWGKFGPRSDAVFATDAAAAIEALARIMHIDQRANGTCAHSTEETNQLCVCFTAYEILENELRPPPIPIEYQEIYPRGGWVYAPPAVRSQLAKRLREGDLGELIPSPAHVRAPMGPGEHGSPTDLQETELPARQVDGYTGLANLVAIETFVVNSDSDVDDDDEYEFYNDDDTY